MLCALSTINNMKNLYWRFQEEPSYNKSSIACLPTILSYPLIIEYVNGKILD